jgi:hypothetical protein
MRDKAYLIRFKRSDVGPDLVIAASAEIHGDHLIFLRSDGSPAALFVLEIVESWSEFEAQIRLRHIYCNDRGFGE